MDMDILLERIKEQMNIQTEKITESVTEKVSANIDQKLDMIIEENKNLKFEVKQLQEKIKFMDSERRRNNLILFGVNETQHENVIKRVQTVIENETKSKIELYEINKAYRLGPKGATTRPILVSFTTSWKRNEVLKNKNKSNSGIYFKEDYTKETLEKRRELLPKLKEERDKGKIAYFRGEKLIVKDPVEAPGDNRKRKDLDSPNTPPNQQPKQVHKKINTTNIFDYMGRGRSASMSSEKTKNK